jgi:hypothetical protein
VSATKLEFTGRVTENGTLHIVHRAKFDEDIKRFSGKDIELLVQKKKAYRSSPQNRYYWGIIVELVMQGMNHVGNEMNKQETHEFIKANFNYKEIVNEETGEVFRATLSTSELNKSEFSEMTEKIKRFAAEYLNVEIPDPNADLSLFGIGKNTVSVHG